MGNDTRMKSRILEKDFQNRVTRKLRTLKNTWFFKSSDRIKAGIPDIIMCVAGQFVALELKRDEKSKPTPLQAHTIKQINKSSGVGVVVTPDSWEKTWQMLIDKAGELG